MSTTTATAVAVAVAKQLDRLEVDQYVGPVTGVFIVVLLTYDIALILACLTQKHDDAAIAVPYAYTLALFGAVEKSTFLLNVYLFVTSDPDYESFVKHAGRYVTFVSNVSHLVPFSTCLLVTFHRSCIIRDPRNQWYFPRVLLYPYLLVSIVPVLVVLAVPLFSECPLVFEASSLELLPACPAGPHSLSALVSQSTVFIASLCFTVNVALCVHGKLVVAGFYHQMACLCGMGNKVQPFVIDAVPPAVRVLRIRRHAAMRQMTCSISAFLLTAELLKWPIDAFEPVYSPAAPQLHQGLSYVHFLLAFLLNFVVFHCSTTVTYILFGKLCGYVDQYVQTTRRPNVIRVAHIGN